MSDIANVGNENTPCPLKRWRKEKGLSRLKLASQLKCSPESIMFWESGMGMNQFHLNELARICGEDVANAMLAWRAGLKL
jgi:transcriptional regulator with XRE-family HTH domain